MYQLIYKDLDQNESTLFYLLCAEVHKTHVAENELPLDILIREGIETKSARYQNRIHSMMQKLMEIKGCENIEYIGTRYYNFFTKYSFNGNTLLYTVSDEALDIADSLFNDLNLKLSEGMGVIRGKYAKRLFQILNQNRRAGMVRLSMSDLYKELQIPVTYPLKEVSRSILNPAVEKLNNMGMFDSLSYRYIRNGSKASKIIFVWKDLMK